MKQKHYISIFTLVCLGLILGFVKNIAAEETFSREGVRYTMNLNGIWDTLAIKGLDFKYPPPQKGWKKEQVPNKDGRTHSIKSSPYAVAGEKVNPLKTGELGKDNGMATWFKRSFQLRKFPENKRVILYFGGIAFRSEIWLNGKKLGTSYQCAIPIKYDVTDIIKSGENKLLVGITSIHGVIDLKNRTLLTPAWGMYAGIRDKVELQFIPEIYIEDVFIKTSVKNKKIEAVINLRNSGKITKTVIPSLTINKPDGTFIFSVDGKKQSLKVGADKTIILDKKWLAKHLWNINYPAIYTAEIQIKNSNKIIDSKKLKFGFKEFEIKGRDFYLNGVRVVLFRGSSLSSLGTTTKTLRQHSNLRDITDNPYNCIRLHLGFDNKSILDSADRLGMMTIPEASFNHLNCYPSNKKHLWLANTLEYYRGWIKENRNRPSVIMWSLANETYWDNRRPEDMAIAKEILEVVKEADPTRPQQGDGECSWNGMLPTTNIHYPEGAAGTINKKYLNSGLVVPNDLHWLKKNGLNESWRAKFVWDRPLMIGEYWHCSGGLSYSSFMGDDLFDWEKWRFQKIADTSYSPDNAYIDTLQKATDWYRKLGVACLNPWAGDRKIFLKAIDVRPIDFHPNFYGGETGRRKVIIFNDSFKSFYKMHLQCDLKVGTTTVWKEKIKAYVGKGHHKELDIAIKFPVVAKPTEAQLIVRLRYWRSGGWRELARFKENVYIMPKTDFKDIKSNRIVLYDPSAATAAKLKMLGLNLQAHKSLTTTMLKDVELIIIGDNSDPYKYATLLENFVKKGGKTIILQQNDWHQFLSELPETDPKHAASQAWLRNFNHPILSDIFEKQFNYWRPNNIVAFESFWKPSNGNFKILLDCGGRYGLRWTPLLSIPMGKGEFILSQLNIISGFNKEPMAPYLLKKMINYCLHGNNKKLNPLRLLAGENKLLQEALETQSVCVTEGLKGKGPVLVDSSAEISKEDLQYLSKYLKNGGTVWLHGFTPDTIEKVNSLFSFKPKFKTPDKTVKSAARRSKNKLVDGLASFDFLWTSLDLGGRKDYFQRSKSTARLGDLVLDISNLNQATPLLAPAFLVKIPVAKGLILFDTLKWEKAIALEADKVGRIISALLTNLGGEINLKPEKKYNYFFVNLKPYVNMGYYDKIRGDKKGGWTDDGVNDMRFFLINHTGLSGGKDGGMPISVDPFPSQVRLAKKPFELIASKKNNGKSIIVLSGRTNGEFLPAAVKNIHIDKKADVLWFLQTACWVQITKQNMKKMAEYVIHYQDGSSVKFPIRIGIEIGDWWSPTPLPKSIVAWTGMNLKRSPIGIWMTAWENPYPDKIIKSIDLQGDFEASQFILLGITGGVTADGTTSKKLSGWNLLEFENGIVKNTIPDMPVLKARKKIEIPVLSKSGLLFEHGQCLFADSRKIKGFLDGNQFKLSVQLTPTEKPDGYYGGIFQCMQYGKAGFRIMLQKGMKIRIAIFTGHKKVTSLQSKVPLKVGHEYNIDLVFKNGKAYLYINNKLDAYVESALPAPCKGLIQIGTASGKDYNFNGVIREITIYEIPQK